MLKKDTECDYVACSSVSAIFWELQAGVENIQEIHKDLCGTIWQSGEGRISQEFHNQNQHGKFSSFTSNIVWLRT